MKKIENELKKIAKEIEGRVLLIGTYNNNIYQVLLDNPNVSFCEQLTNQEFLNEGSKETGKTKKVNVKKIKKRYKKNKIDSLFVQEDQIKAFKNTFIRDSIYVVKSKIYFVKTKESEQIIKMYLRYSKQMEIIDCLDGQIVCIDVTGCKNHKMVDNWFYLIDCLSDIINIIGDILIN